MKPQNILIASLVLVVMLPGCGANIREWADETFYQGKMHTDQQQIVKPFLKGVRLYDQFDTVAIFDALWLSDSVRTVYAQVYSRMTGREGEAYIDFLRRELSANTYFVAFYVLSLSSISLIETQPLWMIHLEVDGKKYLPVSLKAAEIPVEYVGFFGKRINNHKDVYEVRFDRKDAEGNDILMGKKEMKLFFSSPRYYDSMTWKLDEMNAIVVPSMKKSEPEEQPELFEVHPEKKIVKKSSVAHRRQGRFGSSKNTKKEEVVDSEQVIAAGATQGSSKAAVASLDGDGGGDSPLKIGGGEDSANNLVGVTYPADGFPTNDLAGVTYPDDGFPTNDLVGVVYPEGLDSFGSDGAAGATGSLTIEL